MNFSSAVLDIVDLMWIAITLCTPPVLRAILAAPSLLLNPTALSRISFGRVWGAFEQEGDPCSIPDKAAIITPHASRIRHRPRNWRRSTPTRKQRASPRWITRLSFFQAARRASSRFRQPRPGTPQNQHTRVRADPLYRPRPAADAPCAGRGGARTRRHSYTL
ncbi:hypothetical protein B0H15DRAFT_349821 [Mycena belliarum]|uniref:Uncharacterized protein n=1 Tax=Mycena belliarum TaxID=1033014 RepID=A0AAD6U189_9AGAR|nr:hypothetical protein B0H15DRAFT_349821 [Mycena belliae]